MSVCVRGGCSSCGKRCRSALQVRALIKQTRWVWWVGAVRPNPPLLSALSLALFSPSPPPQQQHKRIFLHFAVASPPFGQINILYVFYILYVRAACSFLCHSQPRPRLPPKKERAPRHQHKCCMQRVLLFSCLLSSPFGAACAAGVWHTAFSLRHRLWFRFFESCFDASVGLIYSKWCRGDACIFGNCNHFQIAAENDQLSNYSLTR